MWQWRGNTNQRDCDNNVDDKAKPPASGDVELLTTITDTNGQQLDGAQVFIFTNHTEMTGMMTNGRATERGAGRYALDTNFGMGGTWKITVQVKKPPLDVTQIFNLAFK